MTKHYVALDGLRGIAALIVVIGHVFYPLIVFRSFHLAVDFFFGLSGFVLAHAYNSPLAHGMTAGKFLRLRLLRLYPLYFLAGSIAFSWFALRFALGRATPEDMIVGFGNLFFIPVPLGEMYHLLPLNYPTWSLLCELLANIVFVALFFRINSLKALIWVVALLAAILVVTVFAYGSIDTGAHWHDAPGGISRVLFSFYLGVLVHRVQSKLNTNLPAPFSGLVTIGLVCTLFFGAGAHQAAYELFAVIVIFPLLIFVGAASSPVGWSTPLLRFSGDISYPIYVMHAPLKNILNAGFEKMNMQTPITAQIALVGLLVVLAYLADRYYDRPVRARLKALEGRVYSERRPVRP